MYVISFFTEGGTPRTGLSAKIDIWRVSDNVRVVNQLAMSEIGGGFYKYQFSAYDPMLEYAIRCDGGLTLSEGERYTFAGNEGFHDDITDIKATVDSIEILVKRILGLSQENYRIFNSVYDVEGKRLVGCSIKIYNNKSDCDNDENWIARYTMSANYGENGQMSAYKVVKEAT